MAVADGDESGADENEVAAKLAAALLRLDSGVGVIEFAAETRVRAFATIGTIVDCLPCLTSLAATCTANVFADGRPLVSWVYSYAKKHSIWKQVRAHSHSVRFGQRYSASCIPVCAF